MQNIRPNALYFGVIGMEIDVPHHLIGVWGFEITRAPQTSIHAFLRLIHPDVNVWYVLTDMADEVLEMVDTVIAVAPLTLQIQLLVLQLHDLADVLMPVRTSTQCIAVGITSLARVALPSAQRCPLPLPQ
jgi:hypothetical protein